MRTPAWADSGAPRIASDAKTAITLLFMTLSFSRTEPMKSKRDATAARNSGEFWK
jgi:hypothetical protein